MYWQSVAGLVSPGGILVSTSTTFNPNIFVLHGGSLATKFEQFTVVKLFALHILPTEITNLISTYDVLFNF
jgi:hypothetical protein